MEKLESEIEAIQERNRRVELDKKWETSFTRRGFITLVTYIAAFLFFFLNEIPSPESQALIPSGAYFLSTLSLPPLKKWWLRRH